MQPVKKALILAYDFPPFISVGALRPVGWMQHLHEFGVYPIFVTRDWSHVSGDLSDYVEQGKNTQLRISRFATHMVIHVPFKPHLGNKMYVRFGADRFAFLRRLINAFFEFGQFFLPIGNKRRLYATAKNYLSKHSDIDVVIATADPFILFRYANKLSRRFDIPAIYDYRDPWSQGVSSEHGKFYKSINRLIERFALGKNPVITTVSPFLCSKLKEIHKTADFHVIANGYLDYDYTQPNDLSKKLRLAYAGTIYNWYPYQIFFYAIDELKRDYNLDFEISFYGINNETELKEFIQDEVPNIEPNVHFFEKLPAIELYGKLAQNHILLLFNSFSFMGTKIYDYLAVKRNILLLFTKDSETERLRKELFIIEESEAHSQSLQADLIEETKSGKAVKDTEHLKQLLLAYYQEIQETGKLEYLGENATNFSRKYQTQLLAELIHSIAK